MSSIKVGEKGRAICEHCGPVTTTYGLRDVPMSNGFAVVPDILVGVCDSCSAIVSIPAESSGKIRERLTGLDG